ncbi:MAG: glycosyltransferase [Rhodospirillaceae bacterium]|nr:glycosyltransferase [Rhodospirillaceae bacterium]
MRAVPEFLPHLAPADTRPDVSFHLFDLRMGGAQRNTVAIANGLARRGWLVDLALTHARGPVLDQVSPRVRVAELADGGPRSAAPARARMLHEAAAVPAFVRYLRDRRPRVVVAAANHVHFTTVLARRWAAPNGRLLVRMTNTVTRRLDAASGAARPVYTTLARRLLPDADAVVAVSDAVADEARACLWLPAPRVSRIYEPALDERFDARAALAVDHPWFAPGQPPVIVAAGRMVGHKDFATLIAAFAKVAPQSDARLVLFGDGPLGPALQAQSDRLGLADRVSFAGFTDRLPAYLSRARLFVLSSRWEGLSTVVVEALAAGCPVVSTDCPQGQRELLDRGRLGRLVPVGSADALAEAIVAELATVRASDLLRSRAEAFRIDAAIDAYERLIVALTGHRSPLGGPRGRAANDAQAAAGVAA